MESTPNPNTPPPPSEGSEPLRMPWQGLVDNIAQKTAERDRRAVRESRASPEDIRRARLNYWGQFASKLGPRYIDVRLSTYETTKPEQREAVGDLKKYVDQRLWEVGSNVFLYGPPGTGKDHLLASLAYECILHGVKVEWINGLDWYGDNRDRMESEATERETIRKLVEPKVLYISDPLPPFGGLSDFQASMLFRVVDGRYRQCRPTWVSANVTGRQDAEKRIGAAIIDRLGENAVAWFCQWPSYRRERD